MFDQWSSALPGTTESAGCVFRSSITNSIFESRFVFEDEEALPRCAENLNQQQTQSLESSAAPSQRIAMSSACPRAWLGENVVDHFPVDIREAEISALKTVGQLGVL